MRAKITLTSANDLQRSLSSRDQPPWLHPMIQSLNDNVDRLQKENHSYQLARTIARHYVQIQNQNWSFTQEAVTAFDFDGLYERFREQSRVPELFDKLIEALEQIVASNEIDSIRLIRILEKLIDSLKQNRRGSYFATVATWDFVVSVSRNWLWEELCKLPAIGGLLTALRKTLEDTDNEMAKLHEAMQTEVRSQIRTEVALLSYNHRGLPDLAMVARIEQQS